MEVGLNEGLTIVYLNMENKVCEWNVRVVAALMMPDRGSWHKQKREGVVPKGWSQAPDCNYKMATVRTEYS